MKKITYRMSKNYTDSELLEYLTSSSFWTGDEDTAQERVRQVREYTGVLLDKEVKSKSIGKFKKFRKANLMQLYNEIIKFCSTNSCYCPYLLLRDDALPAAEYGILILPYDIELEAVISLIEKTNQTNAEAFAKCFNICFGDPFFNMYSTTLDICKFLEIETPYVKLSQGLGFRGCWRPDEDTVYVNVKAFESIEVLIMTLAHEIRHKLQTLSDIYIDSSNYYTITELESDIRGGFNMDETIQRYSFQECELDANAFAYAYSIKAGYNAQIIDRRMKRHYGAAYEEIVKRAKKMNL